MSNPGKGYLASEARKNNEYNVFKKLEKIANSIKKLLIVERLNC